MADTTSELVGSMNITVSFYRFEFSKPVDKKPVYNDNEYGFNIAEVVRECSYMVGGNANGPGDILDCPKNWLAV